MLAKELTWFKFVTVSRLAKTSGNSEFVAIRTKGETIKIRNKLAKTQTFPFATAELVKLRKFLNISKVPSTELMISMKIPKFLEFKSK